jgi:hypothetical protein
MVFLCRVLSISFCSQRFHTCRKCHDEMSDHNMEREAVATILCMRCGQTYVCLHPSRESTSPLLILLHRHHIHTFSTANVNPFCSQPLGRHCVSAACLTQPDFAPYFCAVRLSALCVRFVSSFDVSLRLLAACLNASLLTMPVQECKLYASNECVSIFHCEQCRVCRYVNNA